MSYSRLFKSSTDDQDYLHLELSHNVYKIDYELYGSDNILYKGIHINKGDYCCLTFPIKYDVQYFLKFTAIIKENHLSLFHNNIRKKSRTEKVEFTKFYKIGDKLENDEYVEEEEEDNIYTNIQKYRGKGELDFSDFFGNDQDESGSQKLVSLFRNVKNDVEDYDLADDNQSDGEEDNDNDNETNSRSESESGSGSVSESGSRSGSEKIIDLTNDLVDVNDL